MTVLTARSRQARRVDCTWRSILLIASTQKKPVSDYLLPVRKFQFLASLRFNEDGFIFLLLEEETAGCQTGESDNMERIVYCVGLIQHTSLHCRCIYWGAVHMLMYAQSTCRWGRNKAIDIFKYADHVTQNLKIGIKLTLYVICVPQTTESVHLTLKSPN